MCLVSRKFERAADRAVFSYHGRLAGAYLAMGETQVIRNPLLALLLRWLGWSVLLPIMGCAAEPQALPVAAGVEADRVIRICADPDNLPFSNAHGEGFENKIAEMIAADLHAKVQYLWQARRTDAFRGPIKPSQYDLVLGAPAEPERTSDAYYRSMYVFVTRQADHLDIASFDDPRLRDLKIGVQMVGDDFADTPPVFALAYRGITSNIVRIMHDKDQRDNSAERAVRAVAAGEVDVAIVWGPPAGYFAAKIPTLEVHLPRVAADPSGVPIAFNIAISASRRDMTLLNEINHVLAARKKEINQILDSYNVPRVAAAGPENTVASVR